MGDISNFDIEEIFNRSNNNDLLKNFVSVFPSDKMNRLLKNFVSVFPSDKINRFFDFKKMMKGKKHPFLIANTDRSDKEVTHR